MEWKVSWSLILIFLPASLNKNDNKLHGILFLVKSQQTHSQIVYQEQISNIFCALTLLGL